MVKIETRVKFEFLYHSDQIDKCLLNSMKFTKSAYSYPHERDVRVRRASSFPLAREVLFKMK